jgi:formiminotetrahydrofolate cyclodeaminase
VLFLLRPRQTWMPYSVPRSPEQQNQYNEQLQNAYGATRRVPPAVPAADPVAELKELAQLHSSGALTDAEFAAAKAKLLDADKT